MNKKRKFRGFSDGGSSFDEMDMDAPPTPSSKDEMDMDTPLTPAPKDISFKEAFGNARQAGLKTFSFNGKRYTTELASSKAASKPAAPAEKASTKAAASAEKEPPKLLGPTPTKSSGMFSKMVNSTREADRKTVDAAIRNKMAKEDEDRSAAAKNKEKQDSLEKSRRGAAGSVTDDPRSNAYFKGRVNPKTLLPMKTGGAVKKMASGGAVKSSASKRADGCAQRGKTRA